MDYLKSLFDAYLNEFRASRYCWIHIYAGCHPERIESEGYKAAFQEWIEQRKETMIEKANQIIALHDNRDRFRKLKEIHTRGSIVPFVGAGMSIPSGCPGWTSFLYSLVSETRLSKSQIDDLIVTVNFIPT